MMTGEMDGDCFVLSFSCSIRYALFVINIASINILSKKIIFKQFLFFNNSFTSN